MVITMIGILIALFFPPVRQLSRRTNIGPPRKPVAFKVPTMTLNRRAIVTPILSLACISTALYWPAGVGAAETSGSSPKTLPWGAGGYHLQGAATELDLARWDWFVIGTHQSNLGTIPKLNRLLELNPRQKIPVQRW